MSFKRIAQVLLATLASTIAFEAPAPVEIRNGGGVLRCGISQHYFLDWLPESDAEEQDDFFYPYDEVDVTLARILRELQRVDPDRGASFAEYVQYLRTNIAGAPYRWTHEHNGLTFTDGVYVPRLPADCTTSTRQPRVLPLAYRHVLSPGFVQFEYDASMMLFMQPIQLSFFYVHEWLWNFTDSPTVVRRVNRLLQGTREGGLTKEQLDAAFAE